MNSSDRVEWKWPLDTLDFTYCQHRMNSIEHSAPFHAKTKGSVEKGKPDNAYPAVDVVNILISFQNSGKIFWTNDPQTVTVPPR
jgi:hypothetical protein